LPHALILFLHPPKIFAQYSFALLELYYSYRSSFY
jgi:hypothetical protein